MYLKSIEIQGFKSFANKILFEFHNGITGIVGPNGSGKSNVADAVRWVLGEQRIKQLRGGSMQDVIFSGTELRKPQGFAYVAITLDNSDHQLAIDYDQVTVSRRLYRSGESEYRINGNTCRLKDVNELFYDTGIGKEGYSIIGQGQIDKILSGKPEERRELFDEAAGIVKFKRRKGLAQKKLEDEKQNLLRVTDILSELEKQVGPLERQAQAAKEYLRLKEELKICDANAFLLESGKLKAQIQEVEQKEAIVSGDLEEARGRGEMIKKEYDLLDQKLLALEEELAEGRSHLNQKTIDKGNVEGQINVLHEQINTEKMNGEHLKNRTEAIEKELQERKNQLDAYSQKKDEVAGKAGKVLERQKDAEIALMDADTALGELEAWLEGAKSDLMEALNARGKVTARQQRYEAMLEQVNVRRSEVSQKLLKIKSDESVQEEQKKEEERRAGKLKDDLGRIEDQRKLREEEHKALEQELHRLNRALEEKHQEYQASYTRLDSLQNLAERYEGYGNSIRRVMEAKSRLPGIHGVVADLITTEKRYETAIETALGGSIQNIVTDSDQTAKELIQYLKKNKYGRATFLPLTSIRSGGGFSQEGALGEPGVIGLASQLVHAAEEYRGLVSYLLGRVVVAETIDDAIALARKYRYSLRIVTLEGELLSAGGSMTGGAFKNTSNLLGRKRELEELKAACEKNQRAEERLQQERAKTLENFSAAEKELEALKAEYQKLYLQQNMAEMSIQQFAARIAEIAESSADLFREHGQLEEQIQEIKRSQAELGREAADQENRGQSLQNQIEQQQKLLEERRKEREQLGKDLSQIQMETAGCQQNLSFIQENIRRVHEEMRKYREEMAELGQGQEGSAQAIKEKQEEISRLHQQIGEIQQSISRLQEEMEKEAAKKEEAGQKQKALFSKREEVSEQISALDKELFRLQNQKEKLDERLENQVNYMWSEYELTYTTAERFFNPELTSGTEIKKQIDHLKAAIRALGHVNVNAIEDYKEISERYAFLKTQYDDLTQAEAALRTIIEELDQGMRRQFSEQFARICEEFNKVFRELFGGGRGTLELMEDEDILEAGIQIISQPPGKKLQNMMQLSGGEKALTAIALLFAIQNLKPSPFCLLDEIEAALDDSNVDRFAGYLHKLTRSTQFIVITHRRGTMVASDRLYGITMQEKGVSTLVSVSLIEADLEKEQAHK